MAAASTTSLLLATGALPPCRLHKPPSAGGIRIPGLSFPVAGFAQLWEHRTKRG